MDIQNYNEASPSDISKQIFGKFLDKLRLEGLPDKIISRLDEALLKKEDFNELDIKTALSSDIHEI